MTCICLLYLANLSLLKIAIALSTALHTLSICATRLLFFSGLSNYYASRQSANGLETMYLVRTLDKLLATETQLFQLQLEQLHNKRRAWLSSTLSRPLNLHTCLVLLTQQQTGDEVQSLRWQDVGAWWYSYLYVCNVVALTIAPGVSCFSCLFPPQCIICWTVDL